MLKIAITGNIASGKSQVEQILLDMGYKVFDTDKIAHECLENSTEVKEAFSDYDILEEDKISRKKLGDIVFNNKNLRQKLNNIIHPIVRTKILEIFEQYKNEKYVFISIPLLFESNMQNLFDKIILIYCNDKIRLERLIRRNNITKEEALARMNSQLSQENKLNKCDYIVKNESDISELTKQIKELF